MFPVEAISKGSNPPLISHTLGCSPDHMSGWAGKFVSFGAGGARADDVRFQDAWLRLFQERGPHGNFLMKMIRKADQANKSWPRAGARLHITVDTWWVLLGLWVSKPLSPAQADCVPAVTRMSAPAVVCISVELDSSKPCACCTFVHASPWLPPLCVCSCMGGPSGLCACVGRLATARTCRRYSCGDRIIAHALAFCQQENVAAIKRCCRAAKDPLLLPHFSLFLDVWNLSASGKQREADGYDETVLEGERGNSLDAAGFEHPYGRGGVPPARVLALSPAALAQVRRSLSHMDRMPCVANH